MTHIEVNTDDLERLKHLLDGSSQEVEVVGTSLPRHGLETLLALGFAPREGATLEGQIARVVKRAIACVVELHGAAMVLDGRIKQYTGGESGNRLEGFYGSAMVGVGGLEASAGKAGAQPLVVTVEPIPGDESQRVDTYALTANGTYEAVDGQVQGDVTVTQMRSGQCEVSVKVTAEMAAKLKAQFGASVGVGSGDTLTWYVDDPNKARILLEELGAMGAAGAVCPELAAFTGWILEIPPPNKIDHEVFAKASVEGKAGRVSASASVEVSAHEIVDNHGVVQTSINVDIDGDLSANLTSLGIEANADAKVHLGASVIWTQGEPTTIHVEGSVTVQGEVRLPDGQPLHLGSGEYAEIRVSADVDVSKLPADLRQAFEQLQHDPSHASSDLGQLLEHGGVHIRYEVWQGNQSTHGFETPVGGGSLAQKHMHLVRSFTR
jgi:hypothetical protein